MEKRREEGRSTCRWMDKVNVDLRRNGLSGGENAKPDYVKATGENHRSRVEVGKDPMEEKSSEEY